MYRDLTRYPVRCFCRILLGISAFCFPKSGADHPSMVVLLPHTFSSSRCWRLDSTSLEWNWSRCPKALLQSPALQNCIKSCINLLFIVRFQPHIVAFLWPQKTVIYSREKYNVYFLKVIVKIWKKTPNLSPIFSCSLWSRKNAQNTPCLMQQTSYS